jgi:hypothetical protein
MNKNKFPTQNQIIDAILAGIKTAKENFTHWTADELYLSYAPSKFLSIHVAQSIAKIQNPPEIFIDATVSDILRCSLSQRDTFRDFMKKNKIVQDVISLTLDERFEHKTDNDSISRVIITLKNGVRNAKEEYKKNIETICKMLSRENFDDSTLDYGVFAFYLDISNSARIKAEKRVEQIIESFDAIVATHKNLKSNFKGGDIIKIDNIGQWCVGCYIIEPIV